MKKQDKIKQAISLNKELTKKINSISHYSIEQFINDSQRYIKAIQEGRVIVSIPSVSRSGMSRNMKFLECAKHTQTKDVRYSYLQFYCLFKSLGYSFRQNSDTFTISGCGMDMVFSANYNNIHMFKRLGIITTEQCSKLAQMTPSII